MRQAPSGAGEQVQSHARSAAQHTQQQRTPQLRTAQHGTPAKLTYDANAKAHSCCLTHEYQHLWTAQQQQQAAPESVGGRRCCWCGSCCLCCRCWLLCSLFRRQANSRWCADRQCNMVLLLLLLLLSLLVMLRPRFAGSAAAAAAS